MEKGGMNRPAGEKETPEFRKNNARLRKETLANIRKLQSKLTKELLSTALFLLLSIAALNNFSFCPSLPGAIRAALGRPPSVKMISAVLLLYVFSAIILILARMMSGSGRYGGVAHVGYLAGFYIFYHFSGKLPENFWAVFAAGATVFGLEIYHLWIYCSEAVENEREVLAFLDGKRGGRE
ncbi:MAG: menaquinol oxidoreductase [Syntrophus sp. RIFOXYC2_FULL_54_9]|nr:MAG: menaquinol oxidoreductase [Syntrophus sp. RIFOXYC2_FULL_54_9]